MYQTGGIQASIIHIIIQLQQERLREEVLTILLHRMMHVIIIITMMDPYFSHIETTHAFHRNHFSFFEILETIVPEEVLPASLVERDFYDPA